MELTRAALFHCYHYFDWMLLLWELESQATAVDLVSLVGHLLAVMSLILLVKMLHWASHHRLPTAKNALNWEVMQVFSEVMPNADILVILHCCPTVWPDDDRSSVFVNRASSEYLSVRLKPASRKNKNTMLRTNLCGDKNS
jgi:hypothetical protein